MPNNGKKRRERRGNGKGEGNRENREKEKETTENKGTIEAGGGRGEMARESANCRPSSSERGAFRPGVPSLRTDPPSLSSVLLSISGVAVAIVRENYESRYFTSHCVTARRCSTSFIPYEA